MNYLRPLCLAFALALGTLSGALGSSPQVAQAGSLPPPNCSYQDVLTRHRQVSDWRISLLDPIYMVGRNYVPSGLVSVSRANIQGGGYVRRSIIGDLAAMAAAAGPPSGPAFLDFPLDVVFMESDVDADAPADAFDGARGADKVLCVPFGAPFDSDN